KRSVRGRSAAGTGATRTTEAALTTLRTWLPDADRRGGDRPGVVGRTVLVRDGSRARRAEHSDHSQRDTVNRDRLTDGVPRAEQLLRGRGGEHGDRRVVGDVLAGEEAALSTVRARTVVQSGVVPTTVVVQFEVPAVSDSERCTVGATAAMSGATTFEASAVASVSVRVEAEPEPPRTPLLLVMLPGVMMSRLLPSELICWLICAWAPRPSPTVSMTAAIPIRMPRTVSPERIRCDRTASSPVRMVSSQFIPTPPVHGALPR
ncbi:MAG TPA: hypothetical protein VFW64_05735, partial [Pseudonocardiaceae bacterium]|nr:hypothetical protein [Pseudonocardiaceae bacterium]